MHVVQRELVDVHVPPSGSRLWQFPGGNLDALGEDPLQTALRETVEETGLELGLDTPTLLLTHFLHSGPRLPLNKVGLIFGWGSSSTEGG
ncbi:NUDIX hydrolase [Streptomyces anulatus]|uniref:NUDIX hydrolase n=1 Tax=Streptomyces sp. wa1063 TaxID=1828212 RepID=UPI00211D8CBC|nr:NUDIX domain-containing protein [Streptomyces sp. wa1063]